MRFRHIFRREVRCGRGSAHINPRTIPALSHRNCSWLNLTFRSKLIIGSRYPTRISHHQTAKSGCPSVLRRQPSSGLYAMTRSAICASSSDRLRSWSSPTTVALEWSLVGAVRLLSASASRSCGIPARRDMGARVANDDRRPSSLGKGSWIVVVLCQISTPVLFPGKADHFLPGPL